MAKISDKALIHLILFAGAVSFFLGKKVLVTEGDELAALREANRKAA
jgi:Tfp pilus assembly protein PilW